MTPLLGGPRNSGPPVHWTAWTPGSYATGQQSARSSAFVVDTVTFFFTPIFITMQYFVIVSHTVCAHVGDLKNWGTVGPRPLGREAWLTPWKHAPPPCVIVSNFIALVQTVSGQMGSRKFRRRPLGYGALEIRFSITWVTVPNLVILELWIY